MNVAYLPTLLEAAETHADHAMPPADYIPRQTAVAAATVACLETILRVDEIYRVIHEPDHPTHPILPTAPIPAGSGSGPRSEE